MRELVGKKIKAVKTWLTDNGFVVCDENEHVIRAQEPGSDLVFEFYFYSKGSRTCYLIREIKVVAVQPLDF